MTPNAKIQNIISDFAYLQDWEDRYRTIIDLGKNLAPLAEDEKNPNSKVQGCVSQVWLVSESAIAKSGEKILAFRGDSDALIVRGLIALLLTLYSNQTPKAILNMDASAIFADLQLEEHLSPSRANGFRAMIKKIQSLARDEDRLEARA